MPSLGERRHHRRQVDPAVAIGQGQRAHPPRPRRLRCRCGDHDDLAVGQQPRVRRQLAVAVDDDLQRLSRGVDRAHRELRVVVLDGADTGQDRAGPRPPAMAVGARFLAGDPLAGAVLQRRAAVEAGRDLHPHPRTSVLDVHQPAEIELACLILEQADVDVDACRPQALSPVRCRRIRIGHRRDDARDARSEQGIGAGRVRPW